MRGFEKWFKDQDFYTNMRFIHGDRLFDKDGDIYRVLPVFKGGKLIIQVEKLKV